MKLARLVAGACPIQVSGPLDVEIRRLAFDSRKAGPDCLFIALPGARTDGNRYIKEAVERGIVAVMSELDPPPAPMTLLRWGASGAPVSWIRVSNVLEAMGKAAAEFYGRPSSSLTVVGVTGTNGKTTTTYLLESIFTKAGRPCGLLGTVGHRLLGRRLEAAGNTTPLSADLQRLLARMKEGGAAYVAMEVSSHALALKRADEVDFDAAVFTNLGRDHLDFHKTKEEYFEAKARIFDLLSRLPTSKDRRVAVLNRDDETFQRLKRRVVDAEIIGYGLGEGSDVAAAGIASSLEGTRFRLRHRGKEWTAGLKLIGEHNVYNALAAAAAALWLDFPPEKIMEGLSALELVPGRLEPVKAGQPFHVFVDFAHTDSALACVLGQLKKLALRRLITVFGCGGDRDKTKRAPMGAAAARASDLAFATSDNPRGEDPSAILRDIEEGLRTSGRQNYKIIPDRGEAIREAVSAAREGDVVLIAGKGHEETQILKDRTIRFDDREAARDAIRDVLG